MIMFLLNSLKTQISFEILIIDFVFNSYMISFKVCFKDLFLILFLILISLSIKIFSSVYMMSDLVYKRFLNLIYFFLFSMVILVLSKSFIVMFLGWDLLGVSSYLLVIYYQSWKSMSGSAVTMFMNRLGDGLLLISILMLYNQTSLLYKYFIFDSKFNMFFIMILILSLFTKSAQVPFIMWLPEAMEAPTPVSALVHSSTLVTAGIYVMILILSTIEDMKINYFILWLGVWTIFVGGVIGVMMTDSKKVVALSTLSQLGFMVVCIGLSMNYMAFFHLICHASFKAMLFMMIGMEISFKTHEQNFKTFMNKSFINLFLVLKFLSLASLNALPFFSGFYSKDAIFQLSVVSNKIEIMIGLIIGIMFTFIYSYKLWKINNFKYFKSMNYNSFNLIFKIISLFLLNAIIMAGSVGKHYLVMCVTSIEMLSLYSSLLLFLIVLNKINVKNNVYGSSMFYFKYLPKLFIKPLFSMSNSLMKYLEFGANELIYLEMKNFTMLSWLKNFNKLYFESKFKILFSWIFFFIFIIMLLI